uniref:Uncharacterized protein n=2 Tax=Meloidogyne TaxID=189290 RepID=A0A6V7UZC9_MELEN|nr:unnamed protein product [Meloidogyne enterolobii]
MGIYGISKIVAGAGVLLSLVPGLNIVGSVYYALVFLVLRKRNKGALNTCIFYMVPIFIAYTLFISSIIGFRVVEPYKNLWKDDNDALKVPEHSTEDVAEKNATTRPKREAEVVPGTCTLQDVPFVKNLPKKWDKVKVFKIAWLVGVGTGGFNIFYLFVSNIVFFFAYNFLKKTQ